MPYTPMINSVLQASALGILAFTIEHYSVSNAWAPVEDWQAEYKSNQTEARLNQTETDIHESVAKYNLTASFEWHKTNNTTTKSDFALNNENFLSQGLPKGVFVIVVTAILRYWWMIWLERLLPARPRASTAGIAVASEKEDDSREEEVIRKWVEAGKVRRASLSWFNTFAKWFLDMTIGKFGDALIGIVLLPALDWKSPWTEFDKWDLLFHWVVGWFGILPLATLVAFVLVPAHKRIVFEAGAELAWKTFVGAFLHVVIPWAMKKEWAQNMLRGASDAEMAMASNSTNTTVSAWDASGDEL